MRPDICDETGLSTECRVYPGVHDSNASLLRHMKGRGSDPFTVVSTGTWVVVMARGGNVARLDEPKDMLANVDIYGDVVPCGWWRTEFLPFQVLPPREDLFGTFKAKFVGRLRTHGRRRPLWRVFIAP